MFGPPASARQSPRRSDFFILPREAGKGDDGKQASFLILATPARPSFAKPRLRKPSPKKEWSAGRRQGRGPRHAGECYHSLALRAWRAPQNDPLARTACFGRAAPPGAPPRFAARLSTAARGNRARSVSRGHRLTSFKGARLAACNGNRDGCQGRSYYIGDEDDFKRYLNSRALSNVRLTLEI